MMILPSRLFYDSVNHSELPTEINSLDDMMTAMRCVYG